MIPEQLRIETAQGEPVLDYRIHHGNVEVRVPPRRGSQEPASPWRRLSAREFSAHLAQHPALAAWLRARAHRPRPQKEDSAA